MIQTKLDDLMINILSKFGPNIELGPWVKGGQCKDFPSGLSRFVYYEKEMGFTKASMDFVECLACYDILRDIDNENDAWEVIQNFSQESKVVDPWR